MPRRISPPLNFKKWIEENRHVLKPPVANKLIWEDSDFMAFIVAGPNGRTDFHVNAGEEFYLQIEGDVFLKIREDEQFKDVTIREGEIFLLPAYVPHSPQRRAGTVGLVIESKRQTDEQDGLVWWCPNCGNKMYEEFFHLTNIVTQFKPVFDRFFGTPANCTCKACGTVLTRESHYFKD